jgi:hypothetical protein
MPHKMNLSLSSDKRERMFSLVEQYMNGNQTRKDFCQEHGINLNTFSYWQRKYRQDKQRKNNFIPIQINSDIDNRRSTDDICTIELPNGIIIKIRM